MKQFLYSLATDQINGGIASVLKCFLWFLSKIYGALVWLRGFFYEAGLFRRYRLSAPVISVGNLTVGGVGKTPLVEFLAQALKRKNIQPVILMRGYMDQNPGSPSPTSDEAMMLRSILADIPVLIGADRVKNAETFSKKNKAGVFLLDDGFQHRRILRGLDIVAIDATNPWGNGQLLPRGILRESKGALARAQIFVLTKTDLAGERIGALRSDLKRINPNALIVESIHEPVVLCDLRSGEDVPVTWVQAKKIAAVCGIGSPGSFMKILANLGAEIGRDFVFMDHYSYVPSDADRIVRSCQKDGITTVVTTEKDAVKLKLFLGMFPGSFRVLSLNIRISIVDGKEQFFERIDHLL
jgi:tetraacyldisaccharide 4'-kinase